MWQIMLMVSILFLVLEIFMPAMFFLNLAVAALISAVLALFIFNWEIIILAFALLSLAALFFLRPFLIKGKHDESKQTGIQDKYIGKIVKVIQPINKYSGAITIYDERWEARSLNDETFDIDTEVKIVKNESLIMYVEKVI